MPGRGFCIRAAVWLRADGVTGGPPSSDRGAARACGSTVAGYHSSRSDAGAVIYRESLEPPMLNHFRKVLRSSLFAVLAALGLGGTAHATLVVGVFDPDFGGPLAGTNYSGSATFSISQSCLDLNLPSIGLFIPAFVHCGGASSGMEFLGAHVDFTGGQTGSVDFAASSGDILGMYVRNHQVIGIWSKVIGPATQHPAGRRAVRSLVRARSFLRTEASSARWMATWATSWRRLSRSPPCFWCRAAAFPEAIPTLACSRIPPPRSSPSRNPAPWHLFSVRWGSAASSD